MSMEKLKIVLWGVVILGVVLVLFVLLRGEKLLIRTPESYQAVFLDNNQVYFGKLKAIDENFWSLTDIYYLRAGTLQPGTQAAGDQIDLVKLGAEIHGPKDEMIINRDHVIFYEEIGSSGQVMKLIRDHKSRG